MNIPNNSNAKDLPEDAKGNPAYEQTRQDMPLWCCGTKCGQNSRITVLVLCFIGIGASTFSLMSPDYFSFVSLRNDTFFDEDKTQPEPFQYATEARVGLYKYEITDVYVYPWPPKQEFPGSRSRRWLQDEVVVGNNDTDTPTDGTEVTEVPVVLATEAPTQAASDAPTQVASDAPTSVPSAGPTVVASDAPTSVPSNGPTAVASDIPTALASDGPTLTPTEPGATPSPSASPTDRPTQAPTITNPNDIVYRTTTLNTIIKYENGRDQFDSGFSKAQLGALLAPIFAGVSVVFGLMELCCCTYKCSWLPTALFLYLAFMFQGFTLFLFLSEDFCKYAQDCSLGLAGITSVIAILCYMVSNALICMSPRPDPWFNLCKKPPVKRKKKKKKKKDSEQDALNPDAFRDEPLGDDDVDEGYVDPYADEDDYYDDEDGEGGGEYDEGGEYDDSYIPPDVLEEEDEIVVYNGDPAKEYDEAIGYDEDEYDEDHAADTYGGDTQDTNADESAFSTQMTDEGWSTGEEGEDESEMSNRYT